MTGEQAIMLVLVIIFFMLAVTTIITVIQRRREYQEDMRLYYCPTCKGLLNYAEFEQTHCPCGQALDWSEEE